MLASSLVYPVLGTKARVNDRFGDTPVSLAGTAYMEQAVHQEEGRSLQLKWDLEAIRWLQDNVEGSPVILEAHHHQYHWTSRVAGYTGLPTVLAGLGTRFNSAPPTLMRFRSAQGISGRFIAQQTSVGPRSC